MGVGSRLMSSEGSYCHTVECLLDGLGSRYDAVREVCSIVCLPGSHVLLHIFVVLVLR